MFNKKGFVLLPIMIWLTILTSTLLMFVVYKDNQMRLLENTYEEYSKLDLESGKQSILGNISDNKFITNSKLNKFGEQTFDNNNGRSWGTSTYETIEDVLSIADEWDNAMDNTQIIDKIVSNKTTNITRIGKDSPNKQNNLFEIDLINFYKKDLSVEQNIIPKNDLTLLWGTDSNRSDIYLVMSRIKKWVEIDLDESYELNYAKKKFWIGWQYWNSGSNNDNLSIDYIKLDGTSSCLNILDPDVPDPNFKWCQKTNIIDILSNTELNINNYVYKIFLVFWKDNNSLNEAPFKIYSDTNGSFWVGNLVQADLTLLTSNNLKRRIFINTSTKNNVLPYILYSLWVKDEIIFENDET